MQIDGSYFCPDVVYLLYIIGKIMVQSFGDELSSGARSRSYSKVFTVVVGLFISSVKSSDMLSNGGQFVEVAGRFRITDLLPCSEKQIAQFLCYYWHSGRI